MLHHTNHDLPLPFDAFEVHGIELIDSYGTYEQVEDDQGDRFALFGHVTGQGLFCIGDFATRKEAETLMHRITGYSGRPLNLAEWQSLQKVINYLADEELHFESCEEAERDNHIWNHCEILRRLIDDISVQPIGGAT